MTISSLGQRAFLIAAVLSVFAMVFGGVAVAQPVVSVGDVRVVEGDSGPRSVDIMVGLSQAAKAAITVAYATKDGTATAGADYVAANGSLSFTAGEFVKRITIQIVGETASEGDETFDVVLGPATGATISSGTAKVTIVSDDLPPSGLAVYEVRFSFVGSTGSMEGAPGCPVRTASSRCRTESHMIGRAISCAVSSSPSGWSERSSREASLCSTRSPWTENSPNVTR